MATRTTPHSGYSFVGYPDYVMSPSNYPGASHMSHMDFGMHHHMPYSPHTHYSSDVSFTQFGHPLPRAPPSPVVTHVLPASPVKRGRTHTPPESPDRNGSSEAKAMRQLCVAMTKLQSTMMDIAERQEQILDRMSLLEQRVGRMDDGIERIMETTEAVLDDSKLIRMRVEDDESQNDFEARLTDLMDGVVEKLIGGIGEEIKDIKKLVKDTDKYVRIDPFAWTGRMAMTQSMSDATLLGEEPQKEVEDIE